MVLDDSDNWQQAWDAYAGRFEFVKQPPFREMAQSQQMYVVQPQWIRLIDNREGFGFKQELNL